MNGLKKKRVSLGLRFACLVVGKKTTKTILLPNGGEFHGDFITMVGSVKNHKKKQIQELVGG